MRPVLLCLLSLTLAPAAADAMTVTAPADCNQYNDCSYEAFVTAQPGEDNHLTIAVANGRAEFSDGGVVMQAGDNCVNESDHVVSCLVELSGARVLAGDGDDTIDAARFDRPITIDGGPGNDKLTGGPGRDELSGGPGVDEVHGGAGSEDEISFADATTPVRVDLRSQTAKTAGHRERFDGIEYARTGSGDEILIGDSHDNALTGGPGDDRIYGGRGDDDLWGGRGSDVLAGGPGHDFLDAGTSHTKGTPADEVACGAGHDSAFDVDAPTLIHDDCEALAAERLFTWPIGLWEDGRVLRIRRDMLGSHMRLSVRVFIDARLQRTFRRRVASHTSLPPGVFSFSLSTPAIELARADGPVRVTVKIRASSPRDDYRLTLHLLLARAL